MFPWHVQWNDDLIVSDKVTIEDEPATVDHNDLGHPNTEAAVTTPCKPTLLRTVIRL